MPGTRWRTSAIRGNSPVRRADEPEEISESLPPGGSLRRRNKQNRIDAVGEFGKDDRCLIKPSDSFLVADQVNGSRLDA